MPKEGRVWVFFFLHFFALKLLLFREKSTSRKVTFQNYFFPPTLNFTLRQNSSWPQARVRILSRYLPVQRDPAWCYPCARWVMTPVGGMAQAPCLALAWGLWWDPATVSPLLGSPSSPPSAKSPRWWGGGCGQMPSGEVFFTGAQRDPQIPGQDRPCGRFSLKWKQPALSGLPRCLSIHPPVHPSIRGADSITSGQTDDIRCPQGWRGSAMGSIHSHHPGKRSTKQR